MDGIRVTLQQFGYSALDGSVRANPTILENNTVDGIKLDIQGDKGENFDALFRDPHIFQRRATPEYRREFENFW